MIHGAMATPIFYIELQKKVFLKDILKLTERCPGRILFLLFVKANNCNILEFETHTGFFNEHFVSVMYNGLLNLF